MTDLWNLAAILEGTAKEGAIWGFAGADLNVNLVFFKESNGIPAHVNHDVDVFGVVLEGEGVLTVNGEERRIHGGEAFYIERGVERSIRAAGYQVAYLSCHRRRRDLRPTND